MQTRPGQPGGSTRLARVFGLDGTPLRRASDRAETWTRIGLLAFFLIAGPIAALGAAGWASHTGATAPRVHAAQTHHVRAAPFQPALPPTSLNRTPWRPQPRTHPPWRTP